MEPTLKELFQELTREDQNDFRSLMISRVFPEVEEATQRINSRLEAHYMSRFEKRGF